jgi:hypothetical protein
MDDSIFFTIMTIAGIIREKLLEKDESARVRVVCCPDEEMMDEAVNERFQTG